MSDQAPPLYDAELERGLIGAALTDPRLLQDGAAAVRPDDFGVHRHRWIWSAARSLADSGQAIDILTLSHELERQGRLDEVGGPAYLTQAVGSCPSSLHGADYARRVLEDAERRRLSEAASAIAKLAFGKDGFAPGERSAKAAEVLAAVRGRTPIVGPPFDFDLASEWEADQESPAELLPGHLPEGGLVLVAGPVGSGKSFVAYDLAVAAATGGETLGGSRFTETAPVLLCALDNSGRDTEWRISQLCQGRGVDLPANIVRVKSSFDLGKEADCHRLRAMIAFASARLVIIDRITSYLPGIDENSAGELSGPLVHLRQIAEETRACIVLLHQLNKVGIGGALKSWLSGVRGSVELPGAMDAAYVLSMGGSWPDISRTITQTKRRAGPEADPVSFVISPAEAGGLFLAWQQRDGTGNLEPIVLAYVKDHPGATKGDITSAIGKGRTRTFRALDALRKAGTVTFEKAQRGAVRVTATTPLAF